MLIVLPGTGRLFYRGAVTVLLQAIMLVGGGAIAAERPPSAAIHDLQTSCKLKRGSRHTVTTVVDAETLRLDDSRLIRLIGALPPVEASAAARPDWPPTENARKALAELVLGRSVRLYYPKTHWDRYGRTLAHVAVELQAEPQTEIDTAATSEDEVWVQAWLIRNGHARAYMLPGNAECGSVLVAHEAFARTGGLGLWSLATYAQQPSWATRRIGRLTGTFQLIEGRVTSIGSSRGNLYLNFGRRRRSAFSAFVPAASLNKDPGWRQRLEKLEGQRVRVRGWIERQRGPFIEVTDESQVELIDQSR